MSGNTWLGRRWCTGASTWWVAQTWRRIGARLSPSQWRRTAQFKTAVRLFRLSGTQWPKQRQEDAGAGWAIASLVGAPYSWFMSYTPDLRLDRLLDAALLHVPFDGWSETTLKAAARDAEVDATMLQALCPRGAVTLALAYHARGDAAMVARLKSDVLPERFSEKIAAGVRFRIEAVSDKEAVRRGSTLFALPMHAADGAKAIWGTADKIWDALGDTSQDVNWYTKRATLSGVYSATVLFWLGDDSADNQATWAFLDRRIEDVMQIEKIKAQVRDSKVLSGLLAGPNWLLGQIKAPIRMPNPDLPGMWRSGDR